MSYFHGGPAGLREILPPLTTRTRRTIWHTAQYHPRVSQRPDRVYIVTDTEGALFYALAFAATYRRTGAVYEVEPIGELAPDLDCTPANYSWEVPRARVVRTVEEITPTDQRIALFLEALV